MRKNIFFLFLFLGITNIYSQQFELDLIKWHKNCIALLNCDSISSNEKTTKKVETRICKSVENSIKSIDYKERERFIIFVVDSFKIERNFLSLTMIDEFSTGEVHKTVVCLIFEFKNYCKAIKYVLPFDKFEVTENCLEYDFNGSFNIDWVNREFNTLHDFFAISKKVKNNNWTIEIAANPTIRQEIFSGEIYLALFPD